MKLHKISLLIVGLAIFTGFFSLIPTSSGGGVDEGLCFDENRLRISCDDPSCEFAWRGQCHIPDNDEDDIPNHEDNCPFTPNASQEDTDENGIGDACQDTDSDEILDVDDNCPFISNPSQEDSDENGIGDACQDTDSDEILDTDDNCPFTPNASQEDTNENGIGDACQDVDGDEILDINDNCPFIANPGQEDLDENGIGDACEGEIELLVEATFPPGDKVSIQLPPDPDVGIFEISVKLPATQGGTIVIKKTDAGDTPGNFEFLGSVIDFTAPCSDSCEISFTFTQTSLDNQGITLEQVTIFHDMNENGSFESDEAIPTVVTGSDPYTATASASFTSKFSVGGIKALALGALAGSGSYGGGNAPSLENLSFDGVRTTNSDGTIGFGGTILDEISYVNDFPTQTAEVNVPFKLRFPFYEDNGVKAIEHVAVYLLNNEQKTVGDSKLHLIYDRNKPIQTFDPNGYVSNFDVKLVEKSAYNVDVIFDVTFAAPIEKSDILLRVWDNHRRSNDYKFNDLIQVVDPTLDDSQLTLQKSEEDTSVIIDDSENYKIPMWIKYNADWWSEEQIGDDEFVAGIKYLIEDEIIIIPKTIQDENNVIKKIPSWIKDSAGWWADGLLSDKEFVQSIQWIIKEGIMKV